MRIEAPACADVTARLAANTEPNAMPSASVRRDFSCCTSRGPFRWPAPSEVTRRAEERACANDRSGRDGFTKGSRSGCGTLYVTPRDLMAKQNPSHDFHSVNFTFAAASVRFTVIRKHNSQAKTSEIRQ